MAQLMNIRLNRVDAQPWGLRLQGGKDFGTPLVVQKVNHGSISDQAGLQPGDAVIAVNNIEAFNLRHKDAQDLIVRSGNTFELTIQRGGSTWKPHVTPTGSMPSPGQQNYGVAPVTKTSLQHHPPPNEQHIGCGYNNSARPFNQNGSSNNSGNVKSIVNKQYNTPVGMYSEESIAETLTAQAEVLANGVLGVNFKKNEKAYNSEGSEVLKALKESEHDPREPDLQRLGQQQQHHHHQQQQQVVTKHVSAPIDRPAPPSTGGLPPGQNICTDCERLIVGVFVRIKDKNLHVDCFKCATCGTSLKNQGYFNINNKLYCDVHAKLAAVQNVPTGTEGYRPGLIQPNSKINANSTISNALSSHANGGVKSNFGGPRPFGVPTAGPRSPALNQQSWSQPKPASTFANNYGSHTLPRSTVGQNAPANGLADTPTVQLDVNANKKPMENSFDDTLNDYEPGQATEMLTNSVLNLKIESDTKENFKAHAGKILTGMLESRLNNEKNLQNGHAHKLISSTLNNNNNNNHKSMIINDNKHSHDTNGNSTLNGKPAFRSFNTVSTVQKLSPNSDTNITTTVAMPLIIPTSPITAEFPPPPSPSELNDQNTDFPNENHEQTTIGQINLNENVDHVDNEQTYSSKSTIDGFSAKPNPIQSQYQHQTHGHHHVNNQQQHQHHTNGHSDSVVFRNKNTKPELTSHARDRRSYIEKDNFNQNRFLNHNNNLITSHATEIATGLQDGKHPVCSVCHIKITRGPFITALGRIWCPDHFVCVNGSCRRPLQDIGFVEEKGDLYCEYCFEQFLAPPCDKCNGKIKGDCLNAIGKHFHPECFNCTYCGKLFGNSPFFLEDGRPYCEADWNELFTTKCFACGFPVEAGDRWVEALSHNYHSQCFNCTMCKKNLEGQSFYAKAGRPYCKNHAR